MARRRKKPRASVKSKLSRVCRYPEIVQEITRTAETMQGIRLEGSHLANFHLLRCLSENLPLPDLDQAFYTHCLSGVIAPPSPPPAQTPPRRQARLPGQLAVQTDGDVLPEREDQEQRQPQNAAVTGLNETIRLFREIRSRIVGYVALSLPMRSFLLEDEAAAMATNARTMVKTTFKKRLRQYIRFRFAPEDDDELSYATTTRILNGCLRSSSSESSTQHEGEDAINRRRAWLVLTPDRETIAANEKHFIQKAYEMLTWMESFQHDHPEQKGAALYTLLPLTTSCSPGYITITPSTLHGICSRIFKRAGVNVLAKLLELDLLALCDAVDGPSYNSEVRTQSCGCDPEASSGVMLNCPVGPLGGLSRAFFHRPGLPAQVFDVSQLASATRRFDNYVKSDGYGASVVLSRPQRPKEPTLDDTDMTKKAAEGDSPSIVIGVDPGLRALCTAVRERVVPRQRRRRRRWLRERWLRQRRRKNRHYRSQQHIFSVSAHEYQHLSGTSKFQFWLKNVKAKEPWYRRIVESMPTFKTASLATFLQGLPFFLSHRGFLVPFSAEEGFRSWRFFRARRQMQALNALARRLVPRSSFRVWVGYGAFTNPGGLRGNPPVPIQRFKEALRRRATVVTLDEFRTSKTCSLCHGLVEPAKLLVPDKEGSMVHKPCYAVQRCTIRSCRANFWNRDVNAARNMLAILKSLLDGQGRPPAFRRAND